MLAAVLNGRLLNAPLPKFGKNHVNKCIASHVVLL
jgi:hypothetical protein